MKRTLFVPAALGLLGAAFAVSSHGVAQDDAAAEGTFDAAQITLDMISELDVKPNDWPQWGGTTYRNNVPTAENIPAEWDVDSGKNIKWSADLGSQTYGNTVVANGKIFVGTNNGKGYIERYPAEVDLGCLLCFDEATGAFLWQHSNPKLPTGRVHDWPLQGVCSAAFADGDRVWYVSNRGEVVCLDAEGFRDGENDGPYKREESSDEREADVIWKYDMMGDLGVSQHNMANCSVTAVGNTLLVSTSNGVDESHITVPAPRAPSFLALEKDSGKVLWHDNSPGTNVLHGQWSSPCFGELGGRPQVIYGGGDGWVYSFDIRGDGDGNAKLLWKFDCNPKESKWILGTNGTRNELISTPVIYDGRVYIVTGQDPEHGEGVGIIWCIDPTKDGNVSETLAIGADGKEIPHRRLQAVDTTKGEKVEPNPNSAVIWKFDQYDANGNGKIEFEEQMHRSVGTVAIKDDLLYVADFSGIFHCRDARTGKPYWNHDMFAAAWGSPLIADGKVFMGDEDGEVTVFKHGPELEILAENYMANSVYSTPIVANNVLYISNKSMLFAIEQKDE